MDQSMKVERRFHLHIDKTAFATGKGLNFGVRETDDDGSVSLLRL